MVDANLRGAVAALRLDGVTLLPPGGLLLPAERTLVVADLHVGFAAAWRARGNALPDAEPVLGVLAEVLREAHLALSDESATESLESGVSRVVVNGDAKHSHAPLLAQATAMRAADARLRELAPASEIVYVRGNHDRGLESILPHTRIEEALRVGPWTIGHGHEKVKGPAILGHEHPVLDLRTEVGTRVRTKVFLRIDGSWILPALSPWASGVNVLTRGFSGPTLARADPRRAEAWAAEGDLVLPLGELGRLARARLA